MRTRWRRTSPWSASTPARSRQLALLPKDRPELALVNPDDTVIEVAAIIARLRSPLVAVVAGGRMHGAFFASRLLEFALPAE